MFINFYYIESIYSDEHYVGSSEFEIEERLELHENNNKSYKRGTANKCGSFKLLDLGGYEIYLIGVKFCETNVIRRKHEQLCMDLHPNKLTNIKRAYTSPEMKKEMDMQWHLDNHEYSTTDNECECGSHYTTSNKAQHLKTDGCRDYHGLERIPKKTNTCICGTVVKGSKYNLNRHMGTRTHEKRMMALNDINAN